MGGSNNPIVEVTVSLEYHPGINSSYSCVTAVDGHITFFSNRNCDSRRVAKTEIIKTYV